MKLTRPFHFKQFSVQQQHSAMKVTQDACLFAAIVAAHGKISPLPQSKMLDIGSGTGLLSLMLAQAFESLSIDGVELDEMAAMESRDNVGQSPFANRIQIHQTAIQDFCSNQTYDLIISNPPFFSDALKGPTSSRNQARHNDGLSFDQLSAAIAQHLSEHGQAWILLPTSEIDAMLLAAQHHGLAPNQRWDISQQANTQPNRCVVALSKQTNQPMATHCLSVLDGQRGYSQGFTELLRPYYLKL